MIRTVFRADASHEIGMGHLERALTLSAALADSQFEPVFVTRAGTPAPELLRARGVKEIITFERPEEGGIDAEREAVLSANPGLVVFDIGSTPHELLAGVKSFGVFCVTFDDLGDGRYLADLVVDANLSEQSNPRKMETTTTYLLGLDYAVISPACRAAKRLRRDDRRVRTIVVSCGGSDPAGVTPKVVAGLSDLSTDIDVEIVLGAGFSAASKLNDALLRSARTFSIVESPSNLPERLRRAQLGILSGGITLCEAAHLGLPCIVISQHQTQARNLPPFEAAGGIVNLGLSANNPTLVLTPVVRSLEPVEKRREMSRGMESLVDGKGTDRIAAAIMEVMGR